MLSAILRQAASAAATALALEAVADGPFAEGAPVEVTTRFKRHANATSAACDDEAVLPRPFGDNSLWSFLVRAGFDNRVAQGGVFAGGT